MRQVSNHPVELRRFALPKEYVRTGLWSRKKLDEELQRIATERKCGGIYSFGENRKEKSLKFGGSVTEMGSESSGMIQFGESGTDGDFSFGESVVERPMVLGRRSHLYTRVYRAFYRPQ